MIKVNIRTHDATKYLCLTVKGHAGSAPKGEDLVCASATILAYTVAQIAQEMRKKGKLKGKPCIELGEGEATVMLRCRDDDAYADAKQTFSVIETGYALLAHNYPQFVDIKSVG